jgi:hypothetical protein
VDVGALVLSVKGPCGTAEVLVFDVASATPNALIRAARVSGSHLGQHEPILQRSEGVSSD